MKRPFSLLIAILFLSACSRDGGSSNQDLGHRMLLIGNSFFKPYAEQLDIVAADEGYGNQNSTHVFRGGENGWAISFWNDSTTTLLIFVNLSPVRLMN